MGVNPRLDQIEETLVLAEQAVIKAFQDNGLPPSWWDNRDAVLRIRMVISAAAPIIEEAVVDWYSKHVAPLIAEMTVKGMEGEWPSTS